MFRIDPTPDKNGRMLHGEWHPDSATCPRLKIRYINLRVRGNDGVGGIQGHVPMEVFDHLMRTLVSASYGTPNWCEKCHLDGNDSCCRCEIACNE